MHWWYNSPLQHRSEVPNPQVSPCFQARRNESAMFYITDVPTHIIAQMPVPPCVNFNHHEPVIMRWLVDHSDSWSKGLHCSLCLRNLGIPLRLTLRFLQTSTTNLSPSCVQKLQGFLPKLLPAMRLDNDNPWNSLICWPACNLYMFDLMLLRPVLLKSCNKLWHRRSTTLVIALRQSMTSTYWPTGATVESKIITAFVWLLSQPESRWFWWISLTDVTWPHYNSPINSCPSHLTGSQDLVDGKLA